MSWILFIALGIFAALGANFLDSRTVKGGVVGAAVIGGIGALAGGLLANLVLGQQILNANIATFIIAMTASLLVIVVHRTAYAR